MALDVWVGSKLCATEKSLVGSETLGMSVVQEPGQLFDRLIPAPPKIDHQLDSMVIEWMTELSTKPMSAFARKLIAKKRRDWFEVFLTLFIIVNNIEYVYGMQKEFMMGWFVLKYDIRGPALHQSLPALDGGMAVVGQEDLACLSDLFPETVSFPRAGC
ncbi:hypothetical protein DL98DRAFT_515097 [Cadophora sp. DSE1049]|nr:hypothetical protein DL98DRAFT_515097 [Cadophora sp. DSE1049]